MKDKVGFTPDRNTGPGWSQQDGDGIGDGMGWDWDGVGRQQQSVVTTPTSSGTVWGEAPSQLPSQGASIGPHSPKLLDFSLSVPTHCPYLQQPPKDSVLREAPAPWNVPLDAFTLLAQRVGSSF